MSYMLIINTDNSPFDWNEIGIEMIGTKKEIIDYVVDHHDKEEKEVRDGFDDEYHCVEINGYLSVYLKEIEQKSRYIYVHSFPGGGIEIEYLDSIADFEIPKDVVVCENSIETDEYGAGSVYDTQTGEAVLSKNARNYI